MIFSDMRTFYTLFIQSELCVTVNCHYFLLSFFQLNLNQARAKLLLRSALILYPVHELHNKISRQIYNGPKNFIFYFFSDTHSSRPATSIYFCSQFLKAQTSLFFKNHYFDFYTQAVRLVHQQMYNFSFNFNFAWWYDPFSLPSYHFFFFITFIYIVGQHNTWIWHLATSTVASSIFLVSARSRRLLLSTWKKKRSSTHIFPSFSSSTFHLSDSPLEKGH